MGASEGGLVSDVAGMEAGPLIPVFDFTGPALPAAAAAGCFVRWGACHGFFRGLPGLRFSHTESSTPARTAAPFLT